MTRQKALTLQIPVIPDQETEVTEMLNSKHANPQNLNETSPFFPLHTLDNVHFARWIVVHSDPENAVKFPCSLIYAANLDGSTESHLRQLADQLGDSLDEILSYCVGYENPGKHDKNSRLKYLKSHVIKTPGFYVGAPKRTVGQIRNEEEMHRKLQNFIRENGQDWKSDREAYQGLRSYVDDNPEFDWARKHFSLPKINWLMMGLLVIGLIAALPLLLLCILVIHLFYELPNNPKVLTENQVNDQKLNRLMEQEDKIYQNQLSQVFKTKTGLRRLWLHFMLWFASYLAKYFAVEGQLLGTPTIHFARWIIIDGGRRFIFFSNFDGSFDEYLGDFVDHSGWGLNAIYGASVSYPKTFMVFAGGAYKILEFMGWGRNNQVLTQVWYSAYPWVGLQQVVANSEIRTTLFNSGTLNDKQIRELLHKI